LNRPTVVAIGGNSLSHGDQIGTIPEQIENATTTCEALADVIAQGHHVVVTHGSGPQVGNVLLRVEVAANVTYGLPLDVCDADIQGGIGYMLQRLLGDSLESRGLPRRVATVVTQVIVDPDDPEFENPSKPIGAFMSEAEAEAGVEQDGWTVAQIDSRGFRRVVPSPTPLRIVEIETIRLVAEAGIVCICVGGGGVPVTQDGNRLTGCEAVIDKDFASSLLARELNAKNLVITTGVPHVLLDYEKPTQRPIHQMTVAEARGHLADGQFPPGSMGPKIEAAIQFLEAGGAQAMITGPETLREAITGRAGTWITA
jgi:carbamate kinase